jgi:hypothetical protein
MNKPQSPLILFIVFMMIVQLACNLGANPATPDTFATLNGLYTASALTLQSGSPQPVMTATPGLPLPTATANANIQPTNTLVVPSPIPVVVRCDAAQFVKDVTYEDGSIVTRNNLFVKIWRIQNIGVCTWTTSYALIFTGGDLMEAPSAVGLTKSVSPGETVDVQVTFTAPGKDGSYRGYWKLRNASGILFGIGDQADVAFWVDVRVKGPAYVAYEFAPNYCSAHWENAGSALPCPGAEGDPNGFVIKLNSPVLENGVTEDEPALLVSPQDKKKGIISGQFPAFTVEKGDRFRTIISCENGATNCDVVFRLDYKIAGQIQTLGSWHEINEGLYYPIDINLSSLADETIKFILVVNANGGNNQDRAIWLNPHIIRQGAPPPTLTPTFTPTLTVTPTSTPTLTFTPSFTPAPTDTTIP